ncbi:Type I site-specific restriction-modification system, R (restriction) subunit or related helicase [Halanaeroarchaeum sp. HSR-CO]|uniref:type I restriction endonuclease subunit R n=1 Tax=Halanaeroarchaeum sp. HSR-CO TaxID=2866382 RepID=UPI00217E205D|nr:type I restriction endonuclease subunit R [Halanaeroarchaeum sp. HSR-CO]UWG46776.1 Type I site-specific restriction-modification system, R (restriction) subunit or related helicase [Halanaeroarchaeum sp. HSR-CO]
MANEYAESERPALDALQQLGWEVVDQQRTTWIDPRETQSSAVLEPRLRDAVKRLNPWLNENNLNKAVREIQQVAATSTMDENEQIHEKLIRHISVEQDLGHGKQHQTVQYIDFENPENNDFFALNQFRVEGPIEIVKPDIVLFVNGIPLGVVEAKSPQIPEPKSEALDQLTRYQNERDGEAEGAEELFRYNLFSVAIWMEGAVMGTYGTPKDQYKPWRDAYPLEDDELIELYDLDGYLPDQYRMLYALFEPERLLDLLRHYTVFEERQSGTTKMVARYQQYRAVRKALERIDKRGQREANGGVVWHTQGSGKSLTMLFLALKLRRLKDDPTLVLVTDRRALNDQIHATFERCGFPNPKKAQNIPDLRERLRYDAGETITTLIHKFQATDDEDDEDEFPVLSRNENIYVMADEAHRTQDKELANNMRTALPNAFYVGFTGTPIEKDERNTRRTFGNYIDTYTIDQSLKDGATVEILYQGRLADIHLEGETLDRLFDRIFSEKTEEEKAEIQKRYARTQDLAEAQPRVDRVALDIVEHFEDDVPPPFKGMVVTTSKEAAIRYKETLDDLNGPESRVVISEGHNDPEHIKQWTPSDSEKSQYKESFVDPNGEVELLIVCDMLLTGFDAPVAQVMYLDKPLREHSLLQAIARVNRPFEEKTHGLIIDYYGVSDELKEALAMFSSKDVERAMVPVEDKQPDLEAAHSKAVSFFDDLDDVEACVQSLEPEDRRIEFKNAFKRFSKLMDIVLPDPMANPYRDDLEQLSTIFGKAKERYRDETMNLDGAGAKVRKLIQDHITSQGIEILNDEPVSIMDEVEYDAKLEDLEDDQARASEMQNAIKHEINVRFDEDPVQYGSLRERLEELIEKYREGRFSERETIEELRELMDEIRSRDKVARRKGLRDETDLSFYHAVEEVLEEHDAGEEDLVELTADLVGTVEEFVTKVEWKERTHLQNKMRKEVTRELYRSQIDLTADERKEMTNRVVELARAHYQ